MLYVDIPTQKDLTALRAARDDASVSIYLETTPLTQDIEKSRITFGNLGKDALTQLADAGIDKKRLASLIEELDDLAEDDDFWRQQAHSLAIFATPDNIRTFRLANRLTDMVEVSDRFHLKPLLRAVTFRNAAHVLAISENKVRLVEIAADLPASEVDVSGFPDGAADAVNKSTINDRSHSRRIHGSEGQKVQLAKYIRRVDAALRPVLANQDLPLILAATEPVASLVRSVSGLDFEPDIIAGSPDRLTEGELADAARKVLDARYARKIADFATLFDTRNGQNRATTDLSDAARAATFGAIDTLLVDIDNVVNGTIDEENGAISFSDTPDAVDYGIVDEIAGRALASGATVMAVRRDDIPGKGDLAAVLRYTV
ncbi:hypothetical protein DEVEQU_02797 [Devosia equisanguinis]|uniref:Bacterial archaeo-eukaryotic release factor family 8 domain-containing protein n=1 Tax=Devosia equisanguinis TaxID=2490941 RepID=A0A3S5D3J5_9HYPH|nr:hypothetical protein [Devosia equisanguinis]VDS05654.1 hypothetical protein DEVEQU_02797 [Devosia equisanguinis]